MTLAEGLFLDVCVDSDPAAHIRSMADQPLRTLLNFLMGKNQEKGIAGHVWIECVAEATRRFLQGGVQ